MLKAKEQKTKQCSLQMINTVQSGSNIRTVNHNWKKLAGLFPVESEKMGKKALPGLLFYNHTSWASVERF